MKFLHDNGYRVIPLRQLVQWYQGKGPVPAAKSVVIVEDDAHKSVYSDMLPIIRKYRFPVTVFVYPSAISNAKYAMTWEQLRELKKPACLISSLILTGTPTSSANGRSCSLLTLINWSWSS